MLCCATPTSSSPYEIENKRGAASVAATLVSHLMNGSEPGLPGAKARREHSDQRAGGVCRRAVQAGFVGAGVARLLALSRPHLRGDARP